MKTCSIELWLSSRKRPGLYMASFRHPSLGQELRSIRGNTIGASGCSGTFQWTASVQALTILLLKNAAWAARGCEGELPKLEGQSASPASSLGYALSRQSLWLQDMFGLEKNGDLRARRLITGSNVARKRGGPTVLTINQNILNSSFIRVFLEDEPVKDPMSLDALSRSIEKLWGGQKAGNQKQKVLVLPLERPNGLAAKQNGNGHAKDALPSPFDQTLWWERLRDSVLFEARETLYDTNIFRPNAMHRSLSELQHHPLFLKTAGKNTQLVSNLDQKLNARCRLGMVDEDEWFQKYLVRDEPLRIAASIGSVASIAIVKYLKEIKGYNVEIDYNFLHSQDILSRIQSGTANQTVHGVVLAVSCAARLLQQKSPYRPLLVMPKCSHRLMRSKQSENNGEGHDSSDFLFMTDELSSSSFYFTDMKGNGVLRSSKSHVQHVEPDEMISHLTEQDREFQTILWWPYCMFNEMFGTARSVQGFENKWIYDVMLLFGHCALLSDGERARCLDVAIRNAWLTLQSTPEILKAMLEPVLRDSEYMTFLYRANGLHNLKLPNSNGRNGNSIASECISITKSSFLSSDSGSRCRAISH